MKNWNWWRGGQVKTPTFSVIENKWMKKLRLVFNNPLLLYSNFSVVAGSVSATLATPTDVIKVSKTLIVREHDGQQNCNDRNIPIFFKFRWECRVGAATREQRYLGPSSLWGKSSSGSYVWYHVDKDDFCRWHEDWCEGNCSLRQEGIRGLWRGGFPTAQRAALVAGVQVFNVVLILCWFVTPL